MRPGCGIKAGHRDNPPRGIYNPYQINIYAYLDIKHAFAYLVSRQLVSQFFFISSGKAMRYLCLSIKKKQSMSQQINKKNGLKSISASPVTPSPSPGSNLRGHLGHTKPCQPLSKTMPCRWWSQKTSQDNGSNAEREALNYCCCLPPLDCTSPPRPTAPPLSLCYLTQ